MTFLIVSRLPLIIITLSQTIFSMKLSYSTNICNISIIPIIVLLFKAKVKRSMMLALIRRHVILSKGEGHAQYLGIMWLSMIYKLANIYD